MTAAPPYDKPSTLHPFALAVLNRKMAQQGFSPVPGNAEWFEKHPDTDEGDRRG